MAEDLVPVLTAAPAAGDYEAICAALMQTERGRWFLQEYALRNRSADTKLLLSAIERIETAVCSERSRQAHSGFRTDLMEMANAITQTRAEVAAIKPETPAAAPARPPDIFAAAERIRDVTWAMRGHGFDPSTCDQLEELAGTILSASALRDPTDHRAQKLGEVLHYLERRIAGLVDSCEESETPAPVADDQPPHFPPPLSASNHARKRADAGAGSEEAPGGDQPGGDQLDGDQLANGEAIAAALHGSAAVRNGSVSAFVVPQAPIDRAEDRAPDAYSLPLRIASFLTFHDDFGGDAELGEDAVPAPAPAMALPIVTTAVTANESDRLGSTISTDTDDAQAASQEAFTPSPAAVCAPAAAHTIDAASIASLAKVLAQPCVDDASTAADTTSEPAASEPLPESGMREVDTAVPEVLPPLAPPHNASKDARERADDASKDARERADDASKDARERADDAPKDARERADDAPKDARERADDASKDAHERAGAAEAREGAAALLPEVIVVSPRPEPPVAAPVANATPAGSRPTDLSPTDLRPTLPPPVSLGGDQLAALKAMSENELIALFS